MNEVFLERDLGIGDGIHCPLPNGYRLDMIDVTDYATLIPKTAGLPTVDGVRTLQVGDRFFLGQNGPFFAIDIQRGAREDFRTLGELRTAAHAFGAVVNLEPVDAVYRRYRFTWFDLLALLVSLVPPLASAVWLGRRVWLSRA